MNLTMYQASLPVLSKMLRNLRTLLDKGQQYAEEKKFDASVLFNARLAPDMFPLSRQIQIATDLSKGCGARLAGLEVPQYEDNETTLAALQARIDKTLAFLEGITPEQIDGSENKEIVLKLRGEERRFPGQIYLLHFVLPNVYFHITTAYNILRHNGVPIGKMDYLGEQ